jgi:hypothetical protein
MLNPDEEEHVRTWEEFLKKNSDVDGKLPVHHHPGGFTISYFLGDDIFLGEFCAPCAQKVADNPREFPPNKYIVRGFITHSGGEIIRCVECDRELVATYQVTEEKSH